MTGVTADQHHKRTEAKIANDGNQQSSVTWTTAFSSTPVVVAGIESEFSDPGDPTVVKSRSTTGATVRNSASPLNKHVIAQEAT